MRIDMIICLQASSYADRLRIGIAVIHGDVSWGLLGLSKLSYNQCVTLDAQKSRHNMKTQ